jgi:hypothetical protein
LPLGSISPVHQRIELINFIGDIMSTTEKSAGTTEKPANAKPAHKIRRAGIEVAIWSNAGDKGPWYSVTLNRRYKQGEDWKDGGSYGADDLLPLAKMLDEADTWIAGQQRQAKQQAA